MKKLTLLSLLIALTFSCSKTENNSIPQTTSSCINPPTWLQGTWIRYSNNDPTYIESKYVVSSDNIIQYDGAVSRDYKILDCGKAPIITTENIDQNNYYCFVWIETYSGITVRNEQFFIKQTNANKVRMNSSLDNGGFIFTKI